jgi:saccharopine dehydrogenase-like NADP-dependent oxidoreductase
MKAVIFGIGRMGTAISWCMNQYGIDVVGADTRKESVEPLLNVIGASDPSFYQITEGTDDFKDVLSHEKPDVVISSLPYHQLEPVAYYCIDNQIRYCDLGGRVDVSKKINDYARTKLDHELAPLITDLGLAPGWINILAEEGLRQVGEAEDIKMMVGGLPRHKVNPPLNYVVTWSVDGLINEYKDDCEVLKDCEIVTAKGMDGLEKVEIEKLGELEAFYTSGGASHTIRDMQKRGVHNCSYKTLRYPGHRDAIKFLIDNAQEECVREILDRGCSPDLSTDIVVLAATVGAWPLQWKHWTIIEAEDKTPEIHFTAMQKATAYPISAIASLLADGILDRERRKVERRGCYEHPSPVLSYKDIPFDNFRKKLFILDSKLGEHEEEKRAKE